VLAITKKPRWTAEHSSSAKFRLLFSRVLTDSAVGY